MGQVGWRASLAPPALLGAVVLLAASLPVGVAAGRPASNGPKAVACAAMSVAEVARASAHARAAGAEMRSEWGVSPAGAITGRRLTMTTPALRVERTLPAESFVAPPVGDVFLYGFHEPASGSVVRAFVGATACEGLIARPAGIVRSAILDPTGYSLYVHAVARDDRRDLGVSRIDLGTGASELLLDAPPADERFGPTFSTELQLSLDGRALAVQSCGGDACRTRVLELYSGHVSTYGDGGHGDLVAVGSDSIYAFDACHWAPCALLRIDRDTGAVDQVVSDAYSVEVAGDVIRVETTAATKEVAP